MGVTDQRPSTLISQFKKCQAEKMGFPELTVHKKIKSIYYVMYGHGVRLAERLNSQSVTDWGFSQSLSIQWSILSKFYHRKRKIQYINKTTNTTQFSTSIDRLQQREMAHFGNLWCVSLLSTWWRCWASWPPRGAAPTDWFFHLYNPLTTRFRTARDTGKDDDVFCLCVEAVLSVISV